MTASPERFSATALGHIENVDNELYLSAVSAAELPPHHRDPFDRLLIAQAITENMPVLTVDPQFQEYEIQLIA